MLSEDRHELILQYLDEQGSGSIKELSKAVGTSESTIRRDLTALAEDGLLIKVYGGATSLDRRIRTEEADMHKKHTLYKKEKLAIGKYAATLVEPNDFVFIDAGTTTEQVITFLTQKDAVYMTNGLIQAQLLINKGFKTYIVGGKIRSITEAIVGDDAIEQIKNCNFSLAFFGTNGITAENGFTTPNLTEAAFKQMALGHSLKAYVLADPSKFGLVYPKTFGRIDQAEIITTELVDPAYSKKTSIKEVDLDIHGYL